MGLDNVVGEASTLSRKPIPEVFDESGIAQDYCYPDDYVCNDPTASKDESTVHLSLKGPSRSFIDVVNNTLAKVPNGFEYDTVYPAGDDQNTTLAVKDIITTIDDGLERCPHQVYVLLGYSQGATATLDTLNSNNLSAEARDAIKAVILVGNPYRKPNQDSNAGGFGSDDAKGIGAANEKSIPENFDDSGKVLDFCLGGDCICNEACDEDEMGHTGYENNKNVIQQATRHLVDRLTC
ncbi:hypothetical protein E3P92_03892 [Wallemia ichthyophaga]|uniref:Alpha/beta-hydrolase n=1 Tax=Wallemia ichthyophaga TaxID=245174 RepID=A0A4T0JTA6_WALIC|nr:hypothetical protein E3P95_03919 [Wallemia ichthyophaga]TIB08027.1 hypothetical protein E3P92_03892 [Wallemia ichthyophaga]TIB28032.1 hypothetical protein E3P85_03898 [Wallemia ichthyophaga]TIB31512.1 hypothetical protein E3P86_03314 [Wallemia ichthyophaga]TIB31778.1 hypothetical protein E3P84_02817 [Wallemia ichthyophaga]